MSSPFSSAAYTSNVTFTQIMRTINVLDEFLEHFLTTYWESLKSVLICLFASVNKYIRISDSHSAGLLRTMCRRIDGLTHLQTWDIDIVDIFLRKEDISPDVNNWKFTCLFIIKLTIILLCFSTDEGCACSRNISNEKIRNSKSS